MDRAETLKIVSDFLVAEVGETFTFERSGHTLTLNTRDYVELAGRIYCHGVKQLVGDPGAGKVGAKALAAMNKKADSLKAGTWTDRSTALLAMARTILVSATKSEIGAIPNPAALEAICRAHGVDPKKVTAAAVKALKARESALDALK